MGTRCLNPSIQRQRPPSRHRAAGKRAAPPDHQNSALVVDRVRALIPNGWRLYQSRPWAGDLENQPYNRRLPLEELLS